MRDEVITDLDRQIQEALAVDPSPDFQARVRIRLTEERQRDSVGMGWLISGVAGLTAVAALVMFVSSRHEVRPRPADMVAPVTAPSAVVVEPTLPPAIQKPAVERVRRASARNATETVLVPASEREAFRRFLQAVTKTGLTYSVAPETEDAPLSVPDITIEPLVIAPIGAAEE